MNFHGKAIFKIKCHGTNIFVGTAIGRPYDNAECQEDRRRRPLQFMSYIRHIILSNFEDYGYQFVGTAIGRPLIP